MPTATPEPTAAPTPGVAAWTGVDWAVSNTDEGSWWHINDILPWGDGYVGVGSSRHQDAASQTSTTSPAFFTSADGLHWTIAQEDAAIDEGYQGSEDQLPARLVLVGDTLLAVGHNPFGSGAPKLWRTEDGSTWSPLESPTWRDALATNTLISVAAGRSGGVVVGAEGSMCCLNPQGPPVLIYSSDGMTWDRLDLSSVFEHAYFQDVTAYADGFVIVGRVGEPDVQGVTESAVGTPAAWTSPDGVTWVAAEVEGSEAVGATLSTVIAGADGLFATGRQADTSPTQMWGQGPLSGWASPDGRSWQLVGEMGTDLPLASFTGRNSFAGDGAHMVMLGRESCETTELSGWTSRDGVTWAHLAFSGATAYLPTIAGPICEDDGTEGWIVGSIGIDYAVVLPDGVFVVASSSAPTPPMYWFLTATTE